MDEAVSRALLLTDVVDSTSLGEALGDTRMVEVWTAHDRVARDLLVRHAGREIDRTDGFLLLFERAADAAAFALAYHGTLRELSVSLGLELEARAGLHVGEVVLRATPGEDVRRGAKPLEVEGMAKLLAARVMALGRGGQTLLTAAACAELAGALPEGAELQSHGHYRLKGMVEPVELSELGIKDQTPFARPQDGARAYRVVKAGELWRPVKQVPHALPVERDAFVGRKAELQELAQRLDGGARLVAVLGPGGTGKTRLAQRYGWTWVGDWPGGVWFADLSESRSVEGIAIAVASAFGIALGRDDPVVQLGHALAGRGRCLVVLDNFEQVATHAEATLGSWLERAQDAAFVVTSRERLQIQGEEVMELEPLEPEGEGMELFELRANSHQPGFALTPENMPQVQAVVRLVDGLPLAIELAAAQVRVLSLGRLLERMKDRFELLAGARGTTARQATLRAAIDWSWGLLEPWEQAVLAQASVFAGGFTLEAAEAVMTLEGFPEEPWVIDVVQSLVDKSLLRTWTVASSGRRLGIEEPYFGMYLSIEEYAREKLRTEGAIEGASGAKAERSAEERHGAYFASFGSEESLGALKRHGGVAKGRALAQELENLMAATRRALAREDPGMAASCYLAAWAVLEDVGPFAPGVELGRAVLAREGLEPAMRARVGRALGAAFRATGRMDEAREHYEAALVSYRELGNRSGEGSVLITLGALHRDQGRVDEAREHYEAALTMLRQLDNRLGEASVLTCLGLFHGAQGRLDEARDHHQEALAIDRELGNRGGEGAVLCNLGSVYLVQGRLDEAREYYEAALAVLREVGRRRDEGYVLGNLGILCANQRLMEQAREHFEQALTVNRELGSRSGEGIFLANLGSLNMELGRIEEAREHYEGALAIHRELGNRDGQGKVLDGLGALHLKLGRMEEAREHYEGALAIHRELGNRRSVGTVLINLGTVHFRQSRMAETREHFEEALAIHRELGNRRFEGMVLGDLGKLELGLGRREEARAAFDRGEGLLREVGDSVALGELLCGRGQLERLDGRLDAARACLEEAASVAAETRADPYTELSREVAELREALRRHLTLRP